MSSFRAITRRRRISGPPDLSSGFTACSHIDPRDQDDRSCTPATAPRAPSLRRPNPAAGPRCQHSAPATFFNPNPGEHPQPSPVLLALDFVVRSPWRLRTPLAGEVRRRRSAPYPCTLLRTPASPSVTPGGLRTTRTPPTAKPQAEPSPGAADLANSGAAPPRELCSGESRRRPARPFAQGRRIKILRPTTNPPESNQRIPVSARKFF